MNKKFGWIAFLWIFIGGVALLAQTSTNVTYIYDEADQLIGVIDGSDNATEYKYDAAGNLISIDRLTRRGAVDIFFVIPNQGQRGVPPRLGTLVTIHGVGFSAVPDQNRVTFHGVPAVVDPSSTTTMITTRVPPGATTGPVQVTSPLGTGTSRRDFIVTFGEVPRFSGDVNGLPTRPVRVLVGQTPDIATLTQPVRIIVGQTPDTPTLTQPVRIQVGPLPFAIGQPVKAQVVNP